MAPPLQPMLPDGGRDQAVHAVPTDLTAYSIVGEQVHRSLAAPAAALTEATSSLRSVAGTADRRIPSMLDGSNEARDVVTWLAEAEERDRWVAQVAVAFVHADSPGADGLIGPSIWTIVSPEALTQAMAELQGKGPGQHLRLSHGMLRGPNGELFPIVVPPMSGGDLRDCMPYKDAFNADHFLTPDDPTSTAQTSGGTDTGWVAVGDPIVGMTELNPPTARDYVAAAGMGGNKLSDFGTPAGKGKYLNLLHQLKGEPSSDSSDPQPGNRPPGNPFLKSRDHYTPPPGVPMPDIPRQQTANAAVGGLSIGIDGLSNLVHLRNGALAAFHATFERNVDGRTRAIVRLYQIGTAPSGGDPVTHAFYGTVDGDGKLVTKPLQAAP